jgi:hypothetical protein
VDGNARGRDTDEESEDGVLDDAPSFRIKKKDTGGRDDDNGEELLDILPGDEERALSEDARSISTGDDSPSAQVRPLNTNPPSSSIFGSTLTVCRAAKSRCRPPRRQVNRMATPSSLPCAPSPLPRAGASTSELHTSDSPLTPPSPPHYAVPPHRTAAYPRSLLPPMSQTSRRQTPPTSPGKSFGGQSYARLRNRP